MAVTFAKTKRQKYFLFAFLGAVLLGAGYYWYVYIREPAQSGLVLQPIRNLQINLEVLEFPIFDQLGESLVPIPFPESVGRINPFAPLTTESEL